MTNKKRTLGKTALYVEGSNATLRMPTNVELKKYEEKRRCECLCHESSFLNKYMQKLRPKEGKYMIWSPNKWLNTSTYTLHCELK